MFDFFNDLLHDALEALRKFIDELFRLLWLFFVTSPIRGVSRFFEGLQKYFTVVKPHYYVKGRHLFDGEGNRIILRGINKMSVWDLGPDPTGAVSFPEIKKTGANSVRIVWRITLDGQPTSLNTLDALIATALQNKLLPMIELHDATGEWNRLDELANYWSRADVAAVIKKYEKHLLVNVGNEVGDDAVDSAQFIAGYASAVKKMRMAGIRTPIVIDAPEWGKALTVLNDSAHQLLNADPDKNLVFSVHPYWFKNKGQSGAFITSAFATAVGKNYPLIVGELCAWGADDNSTPSTKCQAGAGEVDYQTILQACQTHELGWYAWEWGPGNSYGGPGCDKMDMTPDRLFANLIDGWAKEVAITSPWSIANTSVAIPTL